MTSHELAKLLLSGEDLPVVVWRDDGSDESLEIKTIPVPMLRIKGESLTCMEEEYEDIGWTEFKVEKVLEFQIC